MRALWIVAVCVVVFAALGLPARAGFEDGQAAYGRKDYKTALAAWEPLAALGDRDALLWLGRLHEDGHGVEADPAEAHKWYVLAWKRNVDEARRRALALRTKMSSEQLTDSKKRIRAWLDAFVARPSTVKSKVHGDAVTFHSKAHAKTLSPPSSAQLRTVCSARIGKVHVTFVAHGKQVLLASLSNQPLRDPTNDIWLQWKMVGPGARAAPQGVPNNWAYVYDRNGDGNIDYYAYLDGPHAVIPDPRTPEVERLIESGSAKDTGGEVAVDLSGEQMKFMVQNMRQSFWHLADDNFDGKTDGYVIPTRMKGSMWTDGHVFMQSTAYNEDFDRCRFVPGAKGTPQATCRQSNGRSSVPGKHLIGFSTFPPDEEHPFLSWVNAAARECGLTARHFRAE